MRGCHWGVRREDSNDVVVRLLLLVPREAREAAQHRGGWVGGVPARALGRCSDDLQIGPRDRAGWEMGGS
jgi:hypothetical protein